ncbi:MAG: FtsX-like permease family protein [Bacteroidota bacterium]
MLSTYLKTAWRNIIKHKAFSLINIVGMSMGMSCFVLISLYIQYEVSFDTQHTKADRIYRFAQTQPGNVFRGTDQYAVAPATIGPALEKNFIEVENTTTVAPFQFQFVKQKEIFSEFGLFADTSLFQVFDYPYLAGDPEAALRDKGSIILSKSMAEKYFGTQNPLGQSIALNNGKSFVVRALIEDLPLNQHLRFNFVLSIQNYGEYVEDLQNERWASNNYACYVLMAEGGDVDGLVEKMKMFDDKLEAAYAGLPFVSSYFLEPLKGIHLYSRVNYDFDNSDITYVYLLLFIGILILSLALINYVNLASAELGQRTKEIGMRKILGAGRKQLVEQFLVETVLICSISFGFALGLANLFLPTFRDLLDMPITFSLVGSPLVIGGLLGLVVLLILISGLYPAIVSTSIKPVKALKGSWFKRSKEGGFFRNLLLVGQFAAAIGLAISSVVVYQQLRYMQDKEVGFNRDQIVYVPYRNQDIVEKASRLQNELRKSTGIAEVSISSNLPINITSQGLAQEWEGNNTGETLRIYRLRTDYDFIDLFEIELIEGRNFSPDHPADSTDTYILNEAAVKALGWDSAVGKSFKGGTVIGVVKDFHFQTLDFKVEPLFLTFYDKEIAYFAGNIIVKMNANASDQTVAHIKKAISQSLPQLSFDLRYMDDIYNQQYQGEKKFGKAFRIFTILALLIACMGLLGLVSHRVLARTKEIGIRKVLGASASQLVAMISRDFLYLVLASAIIAIPVSWFSMQSWLEGFAYRVELQWWIFVLPSIAAIIIAFITISAQSLKAALSKPIEAIRTE